MITEGNTNTLQAVEGQPSLLLQLPGYLVPRDTLGSRVQVLNSQRTWFQILVQPLSCCGPLSNLSGLMSPVLYSAIHLPIVPLDWQ